MPLPLITRLIVPRSRRPDRAAESGRAAGGAEGQDRSGPVLLLMILPPLPGFTSVNPATVCCGAIDVPGAAGGDGHRSGRGNGTRLRAGDDRGQLAVFDQHIVHVHTGESRMGR